MIRQNQREMKIIPIRKIYLLNEEQQDIYLLLSRRNELTIRKDIVLTAQKFVLAQVLVKANDLESLRANLQLSVKFIVSLINCARSKRRMENHILLRKRSIA